MAYLLRPVGNWSQSRDRGLAEYGPRVDLAAYVMVP